MAMQYAFVRIHVPSDYALGVEPITLMPSFDDVSLGATNPQLNSKRRIDVEIEKPKELIPFITQRQANAKLEPTVDSNKLKLKAKDLFVSTIEDMHSSYMLAVGTSPRSERSDSELNPLKGAKWSSSKGFPAVPHESNKVLSPKMASAPSSLPPVTSPSNKNEVPPMLSNSGRTSPAAVVEQQQPVQKSVLRRSQGGGSRNQLAGFFPSMDEYLTPAEIEHGRESPPIMPEAVNRPPALMVARSQSCLQDATLSSQSTDAYAKKAFVDKISPSGVANVLSSDSSENLPLDSRSSGSNEAFSGGFNGGYLQNEHSVELSISTPMSPGGIAAHKMIGEEDNQHHATSSTSSISHISSPIPLHRKGVKTAFGLLSPKSPSVPPLSPSVTADQYSNMLPVLRLPASGASTGQNSARTTDRSSRNSSPALPHLSSSPGTSPMNVHAGEINAHSTPRASSNRPLSASKQQQRDTCTSPVSGRLSGRVSLVERVKHLRENSQGVIDIGSLVE
eukprot:gene25422-31882_t